MFYFSGIETDLSIDFILCAVCSTRNGVEGMFFQGCHSLKSVEKLILGMGVLIFET